MGSNSVDKLFDKVRDDGYDIKLLEVFEWKFERNNRDVFYKVKCYHDNKRETFYCNIYPYAFGDKLIHCYNKLFNKY
jgi:hypothetical protein